MPTGEISHRLMAQNFQRINRHGTRWHLTPAFAPMLETVLNSPAAIVKESAVKLVARHDTPNGAFFVKQYRHEHSGLRPLKFFFKASQAHQEWRLASVLAQRGIPIVDHVALGERWSARGLLESILITKAFDGVPLNEARGFDLHLLVAFVQRMAQAGLIHRDFHPANLLVSSGTGEIRLVDLHGIKRARKLGPERIEDELLAQLWMTMSLPVRGRSAWLWAVQTGPSFRGAVKRCLETSGFPLKALVNSLAVRLNR